jgi:hypothetical protein
MAETMRKSRAERARGLEAWANRVDPRDLELANTEALQVIAALATERADLDRELTEAVREARHAKHSWSEIGAMLGVSKQAAQRKYAKAVEGKGSPS